jgi:hypothetical protein
MTVIMGRKFVDPNAKIAVPLDDSNGVVEIYPETMILCKGHQVFNSPHFMGRDQNPVDLDKSKFLEYLERCPPRLARHCENAQIMLVYLGPPYPDIGALRFHPVPTEILE